MILHCMPRHRYETSGHALPDRERDARGPEDDDKTQFIRRAVSSLVENWSDAPPANLT
jgi:hypothetical protein